MIAEIRKLTDGYIVKFERQFPYTAEEVWSVLTENSKLKKWMSNLQIESLNTGGIIKFDMMDGSFINIDILECQLNSVLEFTWDKDRVRFEIHKEENGTLLLLKEYIHELTDHTPRDVAGWHICLNLFSCVLEGEEKEFSKDEWQQWFEIYKDKIREVRG
ncbi:SRPBCC family protein [Bacillus thuringiensis]|uniref:Activator of Hsp90 ATPase 1 family protein n=1 Tax=Bacillus thuringiensis TaxID=1428 RepID=A0A9X7BJ80_BACTU|nr:SRPBCC family protein [Bacillus thuringiensis]MED4443506.1 SRPBCC family protein [Bacillus cereus]PEB45902.1 activator of Hsp90 ATPase 1 family protein [Bacillus thuringiensis]PED22509.1 activator of Hsp90 ATPase 1 family protein [Bacillus thuringiensis]PFL02955.1 activator of Hsp90 ATPase 1 family protein [Bacillus thuringiensis]PFV26018.1 activator of Hsp90 ATPase 1 family protein [Bacillus thuringiensis]